MSFLQSFYRWFHQDRINLELLSLRIKHKKKNLKRKEKRVFIPRFFLNAKQIRNFCFVGSGSRIGSIRFVRSSSAQSGPELRYSPEPYEMFLISFCKYLIEDRSFLNSTNAESVLEISRRNLVNFQSVDNAIISRKPVQTCSAHTPPATPPLHPPSSSATTYVKIKPWTCFISVYLSSVSTKRD